MSFSVTGRVGIKVTGLNEIIAANAAIGRELPQTKMSVHREASTLFVMRAKEHVHKVTGNLARSIQVESITPQRGVIVADTPYAGIEENRPGRRRSPPNTEHTYMKPAAVDTSLQMPRMIKRGFDALLARHKTRAI
jgi:hypothetical protein